MIRRLTADQIDNGINLIDVGASGRLDRKWKPIEPLVNLFGIEPNGDECARLSQRRPARLRCAKYYSYSVAGENASATLYKTKSIYCYSLLRPNMTWLQRFRFADLFQIIGSESIETRRLDAIPELQAVDVDAIKIDTQGLELPILRSAEELLERTFYVETETGFVDNYHGETTYAEIDEFMRGRGFLLFDLKVHRVARKNPLGKKRTGKEQLIWCEAVWLRDYAASKPHPRQLTRAKALKVLVLCALQQCYDFGYELAEHFHQAHLLSSTELSQLSRPGAWRLGGGVYRLASRGLASLVQLSPADHAPS